MPAPGRITTEIREDATLEVRTLAQLLRDLCAMCHQTLVSQRAIAEEMLVTAPALSGYLKGDNVLSQDALERLWEAALSSSAGAGHLPPLEHVLRVRLQAELSHRGLEDMQVIRRAAAVEARLRKEGRIPSTVSPDADDALRYLQRGNFSSAFTLFWNIGRSQPAAEIRDVVAACRIAGRGDAAQTVLSGAAERPPAEVLRIAAAFHAASRHDDAAALVNASLGRNN